MSLRRFLTHQGMVPPLHIYKPTSSTMHWYWLTTVTVMRRRITAQPLQMVSGRRQNRRHITTLGFPQLWTISQIDCNSHPKIVLVRGYPNQVWRRSLDLCGRNSTALLLETTVTLHPPVLARTVFPK